MSLAGAEISITSHTTASNPTPHILYFVQVRSNNGEQYQVLKRFSEFDTLHETLGDPYTLPPKHILANSLRPTAWVDDKLLAERKRGLAEYLNNLLRDPKFSSRRAVTDFLSRSEANVDPEMCSIGTVTQSVLQKEFSVAPKPISAAYYPSWSAWSCPPNKLDFSKFDVLLYSFVVPNSSATISWDSGSQETLRTLVSSARRSGKGTKIVLSIGGWAGSYWFSHSVSNGGNRQKLANSLIGAVNTFGLDGIDIDWEYPNSPGSGNPHSSNDAVNLLAFIKLLRAGLGWSRIISAAVAHQPWLGPDGRPLRNVADFAAQMTYVNIMNYDVTGGATPGPNAPLGNECHLSTPNAHAALAAWTAAGFPASKLLLGLPLYGYVIKSSATRMPGSLQLGDEVQGAHPRGTDVMSPNDTQTGASSSTVAQAGDLSSFWGQQIAFGQLLARGAIRKQPDGTYVASTGYQRGWDHCSSTPFLFDPSRNTFVSYDDPASLALKAEFVKQKGMAGCFTWSLDQDDGLALQNVIRNTLRK